MEAQAIYGEEAAALAKELVEKLRLAGHITVASDKAEQVASLPCQKPCRRSQKKRHGKRRRSKSPPKPKPETRRSKSPPQAPTHRSWEDDEEAALQRQLDDTDDFASAWSACAAQGKAGWPRGAGGRESRGATRR